MGEGEIGFHLSDMDMAQTSKEIKRGASMIVS